MLLAASLARAEPVDDADKAFSDLEFERAEKLYLQSLNGAGKREDRVRAWKGLGLSQAYQGQAKAAKASFEKLLLLEPETRLEASLGPKILKPFELARKSIGAKRNTLDLQREEAGSLRVVLREDVPMAATVALHSRVRGDEKWEHVVLPAAQPIIVVYPGEKMVEAWAEALDAKDGVVMNAGTEAEPRRFKPTRTLPAVDLAVSEAKNQQRKAGTEAASDDKPTASDDDDDRPTRWPIYVAVGAAVIGGGVAAYFLAQPPALHLPPADRTDKLP